MANSESLFQDKVLLVTNSNTPIGRSLTGFFSAHGAKLVLHDASWGTESKSSSLTKLVASSLNTRSDADNLVHSTVAEFGSIDGLVTGIAEQDVSDASLAQEETTAILSQTVAQPLNITQAVAQAMVQSGKGGSIVNLATAAGMLSAEHCSLHSAISSAIVGFNRSLAQDYRESNISINTVLPIARTAACETIYGSNQLAAADYDANNVVAAVAYLLSGSNRLQGEALSVGGGRVARYLTSTVPGYFNLDAQSTDIDANIEKVLNAQHAVEMNRAIDELLFIDV